MSPVPGVSATTQSQVLCAAWRRAPGVLLSGSVAITDEAGNRRKFETPEAFENNDPTAPPTTPNEDTARS